MRMRPEEFIKRESFFIGVAVGLILILIYFGFQGGTGEEKVPAGTGPFFTMEEVKKTVESGRVPPLVLELISLIIVIFITFFIAGVILNLSGLLRKNWRMFTPGPSPQVEWGIWPVAKIFVYFIFLLFLFQILEGVVLKGLDRGGPVSQASLLIANALFQDVLIVVLVFGFLRKFNFSRWAFPISFRNWYLSFRQGVRGYVFFFPVLLLLIWISYIANRFLGWGFDSHPLVEPLLKSDNPFLLFSLFCIAILFAPLVEEIFFRGFLYPALKKRVSVPGSILISAVLFSTLHLSVSGWLPILGLGILLAYSYEKTGKLLVPIIIHAIHNALFLTYAVLLFRIGQAVN